jgi:diguanylate cyclase
MVLLPGATRDAGLAKARAMVEAIAARPFALEDGRKVAITISAGVAAARPGDDATSLVLRADEALYRAKHGGRNRAEPESG